MQCNHLQVFPSIDTVSSSYFKLGIRSTHSLYGDAATHDTAWYSIIIDDCHLGTFFFTDFTSYCFGSITLFMQY